MLAVYFSMMRRKAICAVDVMASASSRMMSLKEVIEEESEVLAAEVKICFVPALFVSCCHMEDDKWRVDRLANVLICSRTTSMPRSSLALSSKTICRMFLFPYIRRARASIVDVFPVPGGP